MDFHKEKSCTGQALPSEKRRQQYSHLTVCTRYGQVSEKVRITNKLKRSGRTYSPTEKYSEGYRQTSRNPWSTNLIVRGLRRERIGPSLRPLERGVAISTKHEYKKEPYCMWSIKVGILLGNGTFLLGSHPETRRMAIH